MRSSLAALAEGREHAVEPVHFGAQIWAGLGTLEGRTGATLCKQLTGKVLCVGKPDSSAPRTYVQLS